MKTFKIRKWREYQRYRDRRPRWFCVYTTLKEDLAYEAAIKGISPPTDQEIGQIVLLFALATKRDKPDEMPDGPDLPYNSSTLKQVANMSEEPDLERLITLSVIVCNKMLQDDTESLTPMGDSVHQRTVQNSTEQNIVPNEIQICKNVIEHLNKKTGARFSPKAKATIRIIKARLNEGRTPEDFIAVIDNRAAAWLTNPDMIQYLRPETLFNATKMESYLGMVTATRGSPAKELRPYDIEEIEEERFKEMGSDHDRERQEAGDPAGMAKVASLVEGVQRACGFPKDGRPV